MTTPREWRAAKWIKIDLRGPRSRRTIYACPACRDKAMAKAFGVPPSTLNPQPSTT